ncbi:MAG: glutamate-5-semialdehyde dehydrogenase, partial [Deltaproteobacteria bacterium]|nr:glutamate-5-semialdehyde dehydrogenase [Deltaproteobacteria bacterium]
MDTLQKALQAANANKLLATLDGKTKNMAIGQIIKALKSNRQTIVAANQTDLELAEKAQLADPLLKRLKFDDRKIEEACEGLSSLLRLADPVGKVLSATELDRGLELYKVSSPIGVIGMIFESRPDALVQIASLCLKSGNGVLLKGGSEAANTNHTLADIISHATVQAGIPEGWLGLMETRSDVQELLGLSQYVDLIVPRGSNQFVQHIMHNTTIPVLGHADGICHVYIDRDADIDMALDISIDSKCQYVSVCNAVETLLVHEKQGDTFLPRIKKAFDRHGVELRGCKRTQKIIAAVSATEEDWQTEYLDLIISIKIVNSIENAIDHINRYGSGHTDVIVSSNRQRAAQFMEQVDSAD